MPSVVERPARFAAEACPLTRRISTALSMSPSASASALLQSIIAAPVRSRSALTSAAVISLTSPPCSPCGGGVGRGLASRPRLADRGCCATGTGFAATPASAPAWRPALGRRPDRAGTRPPPSPPPRPSPALRPQPCGRPPPRGACAPPPRGACAPPPRACGALPRPVARPLAEVRIDSPSAPMIRPHERIASSLPGIT